MGIYAGRSIGSGPAVHICSQADLGALVLVSPFTSIKCVAKNIAGSLGGALVKQRFENLTKISQVSSPILIIHGEADELIPIEQSRRLEGRIIYNERSSQTTCGTSHEPYNEA